MLITSLFNSALSRHWSLQAEELCAHIIQSHIDEEETCQAKVLFRGTQARLTLRPEVSL